MRWTAALVVLTVGIFGRANALDSLNCRLVGSCDLPTWAVSGVALSGNFAYVCDGYGTLWILDVSDPTAPNVIGRFDTTDMTHSIAVFGNLAYMTAYGSFTGLWIIDVSDPGEPYAVGQYSSPYRVDRIVLSVNFDYAHMPAGFKGLRILDMTDPQEPYEAGHWDGLGNTSGVALSGNLAYVTDHDSGVQIIDVSNPQAPHQVGGCGLAGYAISVAVSGDFAYVGGGDRPGKLWVIDVSNPQGPHEVGWAPLPDLGAAVVLSGNLVYVAVQDGYLYVIDVSNPQNPHAVGWYELEGAVDVAVSGNLAYVTDYVSGLKIVEFLGEGVAETPNGEVRLAKCVPTVVRDVLFLPAATSHKPQATSLLDISGTKVMDLLPGANDVRALVPGVYFVREAQAQAQARANRKVVVTR
jgi:hypothetical protein